MAQQKIAWGLIGWNYPVADSIIWDRREKEWGKAKPWTKLACFWRVLCAPYVQKLSYEDRIQELKDELILKDRQIANLIERNKHLGYRPENSNEKK